MTVVLFMPEIAIQYNIVYQSYHHENHKTANMRLNSIISVS